MKKNVTCIPGEENKVLELYATIYDAQVNNVYSSLKSSTWKTYLHPSSAKCVIKPV